MSVSVYKHTRRRTPGDPNPHYRSCENTKPRNVNCLELLNTACSWQYSWGTYIPLV